MTFVYVSTPAIFALLTLIGAGLAGARLRPVPGAVRVSLWLGAGQAGLVLCSAWLTYERAISSAACLTAIFGWMGLAFLGVLDALSLIWWLWSRREDGIWPLPILFVLLRVGAHWLLVLALMWHAALCTV